MPCSHTRESGSTAYRNSRPSTVKGHPFAHLRFNRPRRKQDLNKLQMPKMLGSADRSCSNKTCLACPLLLHPNYVASKTRDTTHPVTHNLRCTTMGVVYLLTCRRCGKQYVGQTAKSIRERLADTGPASEWHPCHSIHISFATTIVIPWTYP